MVNNIKQNFRAFLFLLCLNSYAQETPLGSKIVGNGDSANYYIGHFPVAGADGLDLHWYGGIRFGDWKSKSVMQITDGNVGIGTQNPSSELSVLGVLSKITLNGIDGTFDNLIKYGHKSDLESQTNFANRWHGIDATITAGNASDNKLKFRLYAGSSSNLAPKDVMTLVGNGNVGVGTTNPLSKLEVNSGNILVRNYANIDNESAIMIAHSINATNYDTYGTSIRTITQSAGNNTYGLQFFTQESYLKPQTEKLRILGNGNVGIGIANPNNKLDVNGVIHSQEVKVDMTGWSDFVFKKDYNLPTLEEVEKHIAEKGHLENIPSEEEVLKNGINLGEMNSKLLQKIEELTLYLIDLEKKNDKQSSQIEMLEKENKTFKMAFERLSVIEEKLK
jgi:hypothetical protein